MSHPAENLAVAKPAAGHGTLVQAPSPSMHQKIIAWGCSAMCFLWWVPIHTPHTSHTYRRPHLVNWETHGALSFPWAQDPATLDVTPKLRRSLSNKFPGHGPQQQAFPPQEATLPDT